MADEHEQVTRSVDLDAAVDEVWQAVADPGERALWLDDPDAAVRRVRVDEVTEAGDARRLVWTWWRPGDEGDASTVAVVVAPRIGGGSRVVVTESLPAVPPVRAQAGAAAAPTGVAAGRGWVRALWDHRLLGLELLFLATRAPVAVA